MVTWPKRVGAMELRVIRGTEDDERSREGKSKKTAVAEEKAGMDGSAVLRQLVGQIQELREFMAVRPRSTTTLDAIQVDFCRILEVIKKLDMFPTVLPLWYILELNKISLEYDFCGLLMEGKSGQKMVEVHKLPPCKKSRREKNPAKVLESISSELMEQQIWKDFPEDLFEAVIARLPVESFFRFRTVCREWNLLLNSSSFSQHVAEVPQEHPWFYTVTHENISTGAMYNPSLRKWYHPSIPLLPAKTIILPVASAGGLICFLDLGHKNFYVCNPLTDSFRELPPRSFRVWSRVAVGMVLHGKTAGQGYKIMWLGCSGDNEIYDSVQNSWTRNGAFPPGIKLPLSLNFRSQTISVGTTLYFMHAEPDGILSYDVTNGVWKQYIIPSPSHLSDHTLTEYGGKLMLVGLVTKNAATCIYIWELQRMTLLWKEVDRMPNDWCLELYGKHVRMTCLGNQGLLMLSLRSRRMNRLVMYNLCKKVWQRVPECLRPHGRKQTIACGTAFHPCPTALA